MTATSTDPRPALRAAIDQVGRVLERVQPDQAHLPTPCADFDVSLLVEHLQGVLRRVAVVLAGEPFDSAPGSLPSTAPLADWASGRAAVLDVVATDGVLSREVSVPWGVVPGAAAVAAYAAELTVHSWDLAVATDSTGLLDPALAEVALAGYQGYLPPEPRGGVIPFGPVIEVGPEAGAYERLVAYTGRDPVGSRSRTAASTGNSESSHH